MFVLLLMSAFNLWQSILAYDIDLMISLTIHLFKRWGGSELIQNILNRWHKALTKRRGMWIIDVPKSWPMLGSLSGTEGYRVMSCWFLFLTLPVSAKDRKTIAIAGNLGGPYLQPTHTRTHTPTHARMHACTHAHAHMHTPSHTHMLTHQLFSIRVGGSFSLSLWQNMFQLIRSQGKEQGRKDRKRMARFLYHLLGRDGSKPKAMKDHEVPSSQKVEGTL